VAACSEFPADPSRPAARVQNPGTAPHHRVDHASLARKVVPLRGHGAETLHIPPGMAGILLHHGFPAGDLPHGSTLPPVSCRRPPRPPPEAATITGGCAQPPVIVV